MLAATAAASTPLPPPRLHAPLTPSAPPPPPPPTPPHPRPLPLPRLAHQRAPAHAEKIWQHLVECKYLLMDMIKPGASCRAIYDAFLRKLSQLDLPPISFVGHGIGLHLHEDPYIGTTPEI